MLIAAADIRGYDLQDHAVIGPFAARVDELREVDAVNFHFARTGIDHSTIARHAWVLLVDLFERSRAGFGDCVVLLA
jgi:hypothetical protein